jgi:hypothetical protein
MSLLLVCAKPAPTSFESTISTFVHNEVAWMKLLTWAEITWPYLDLMKLTNSVGKLAGWSSMVSHHHLAD